MISSECACCSLAVCCIAKVGSRWATPAGRLLSYTLLFCEGGRQTQVFMTARKRLSFVTRQCLVEWASVSLLPFAHAATCRFHRAVTIKARSLLEHAQFPPLCTCILYRHSVFTLFPSFSFPSVFPHGAIITPTDISFGNSAWSIT